MSITLAQADTIITTALQESRTKNLAPMTVVVLDAGGHLVAAKREDNSGILRIEIATGKAYGALGFGFSSRGFADKPAGFVSAASVASGGRLVPVPGGVLVKNAAGAVIGAVGVSGDASNADEAAALAGIHAAGLASDIAA
ncbi:MAG: heme-binding protein [Pseudomonadota bacterium]